MLTTKALVQKALLEGVDGQILDLASAIVEAEMRALGFFCQSDDDWLISKYAVGPMREELTKLKAKRAELVSRFAA